VVSSLAARSVPLALPVDHPYPAREGFAADEVDVSVDAPTAASSRTARAWSGLITFGG
jgi:hypothetical protein